MRIRRPIPRPSLRNRKMRFGIDPVTRKGTLSTTCLSCYRPLERYVADVIAANNEILCARCGQGARYNDFEFEKFLGPGDRSG